MVSCAGKEETDFFSRSEFITFMDDISSDLDSMQADHVNHCTTLMDVIGTCAAMVAEMDDDLEALAAKNLSNASNTAVAGHGVAGAKV